MARPAHHGSYRTPSARICSASPVTPEPAPGAIDRHIGPSLHRLLDRLSDTPVMVADAAGEIVAANALAAALIGYLSGASRRERTMAWRHFTGMPARIVRSEEAEARAEAGMVGELREALSCYPSDQYLGALIEDLTAISPRFADEIQWRRSLNEPDREPAARRAQGRLVRRTPPGSSRRAR